MKKIIDALREGTGKIKLFSSIFAERVRIEMAILRLLYETDKISKNRESLLKKIGERVFELKDNQEKNILKDSVISEALKEIAELDKSIDDLKDKVSDMGKAS